MTLKVGTRVIVGSLKDADKFLLGIITADTGSKFKVKLDSDKEITSSLSRITPCTYYAKFLPRGVNKAWVEENKKFLKPVTFDVHAYFLQKKGAVVTVPLITSMWYWGNHYLFHNKLTLPILRSRTPRRGQSGCYQYKASSPDKDILCLNSATLNTFYEIFETEMHEMVHQYNYRIDWLEKKQFDPAGGAHGNTFFSWRGPLQQIARVKLTKLHDLTKTELEELDEEAPKSKEPLYVLVGMGRTSYIASKSREKSELLPLFNYLRGTSKSNPPKIVKIDKLPLLNAVTSNKSNTVGSGKRTPYGYISPVAEPIYKAIMEAHIKG